MENASKALLIAGAILICILLIGVGMMVYQGAQSTVEEGLLNMDENQKRMFNSKFVDYEGDRVSGSNVRALIRNVMSSNGANSEIEGKLVSIDGDKKFEPTAEDLQTNAMSAYSAQINTGATYKVVLEYSNASLVNKVIITRNTK